MELNDGKDTLDRQVNQAQHLLSSFLNMFKPMTFLVLVALAACVVSKETQDQETAEQYFRVHGVYPSWYQYGGAFNGVRAVPYTGYPAATYTGYYPSSYYPNGAIGFNRFPNSPYAGSQRGWFDADMYPFNFYNYNAIPYLGPATTTAKPPVGRR